MSAAAPALRGARRGPTPRPESPWRLALRRVRRDRVAVAAGGFVVCLLLAVSVGAPLAAHLLHHGPNDPFPYAVDVNTKPTGPWTRVPALNDVQEPDEFAVGLPKPPEGTPGTLLVLGADGALGRDELLRLLYGGRVSLEVAVGATALAILIGAVLGSIAAYFGGLVDAVISRLTDLVIAFPLLLFLIMLGTTTVGDKLVNITFGGVLNRGVFALVV